MKWAPEDGWPSLAVRILVSLAAGALLVGSLLGASATERNSRITAEQGQPVQEDPATVAELQRRIAEVEQQLRQSATPSSSPTPAPPPPPPAPPPPAPVPAPPPPAPAPAPAPPPAPAPAPAPPPAGEEDGGGDGDG